MIYLANPSGERIRQAMRDHPELGMIATPRQRKDPLAGVAWCADNGAFSDSFDLDSWWRFLLRHQPQVPTCLFAALPDVVADWPATLALSLPLLGPVKALGYPVALVLQDGATSDSVPWADLDAVFVGGSTAWKLGSAARALVIEAKERGLWVHFGRVNSERRLRYAAHLGADSADGTYLVFGPDVNLARLLAWLRGVNDQGDLFRQS